MDQACWLWGDQTLFSTRMQRYGQTSQWPRTRRAAWQWKKKPLFVKVAVKLESGRLGYMAEGMRQEKP
jgi:hypothetical protein